jgi:hypothetical protein
LLGKGGREQQWTPGQLAVDPIALSFPGYPYEPQAPNKASRTDVVGIPLAELWPSPIRIRPEIIAHRQEWPHRKSPLLPKIHDIAHDSDQFTLNLGPARSQFSS